MTATADSVPVLIVPAADNLLLLPSAMVCEVIQNIDLLPAPGSRDWMLGYCMWRDVPVPMVSFGRLLGVEEPESEVRRMVIMYPLPGRQEHDYFGIATSGQPRNSSIGAEVQTSVLPAGMPRRYVAAAVELPGGVGIIPDFQALQAVFYSN